MAATWETLNVDGSEMRTYMALPDTAGPAPGVVVAQHGAGVDNFIHGIVDRLASEGFAAIAPDLYHRDDPDAPTEGMARIGRLRDDRIVRDMTAARDYLGSQPGVRADRIGVTGFCMGGRVAYLMAVNDPECRASAVFYGAFSFVPWGEGPAPIEGTARITCPVLGLFGDEDQNPTPEQVHEMDAELTKHSVAHEFHSYPGTGHGFMVEGSPAYRTEAARDGWEKTMAWFRRYLA